MSYENYAHDISLTELAEVKRIRKNDILTKGTIYIRVSACKKNNDEDIWYIMSEDGNPGEGYAYLVPKQEWISEYVMETLNRSGPRFMERYVGKNINISLDLFKFYKFDYHKDLDKQLEIAMMLNSVKQAIFNTERKIHEVQEIKQYALANMFAGLTKRQA